jgi:hypothetical protein
MSREIPKTCGDCPHFDRWNDGECTRDDTVPAERTEAPPEACPLRRREMTAEELAACRELLTQRDGPRADLEDAIGALLAHIDALTERFGDALDRANNSEQHAIGRLTEMMVDRDKERARADAAEAQGTKIAKAWTWKEWAEAAQVSTIATPGMLRDARKAWRAGFDPMKYRARRRINP